MCYVFRVLAAHFGPRILTTSQSTMTSAEVSVYDVAGLDQAIDHRSSSLLSVPGSVIGIGNGQVLGFRGRFSRRN